MQSEDIAAIRVPDLSGRPYHLTLDRHFAVAPPALYQAWTTGFDRWFAAPGSMLMQPVVNAVYFFETEYQQPGQPAQRHPHYGRFIRLIADRLVELTWVTGAGGTEGAETVVTVQLQPIGQGTHLRLAHAGFAGESARDRHHQAWPFVLDQLDKRIVA
jgi:uncharacterized protein YndB with AHSA1/START domain